MYPSLSSEQLDLILLAQKDSLIAQIHELAELYPSKTKSKSLWESMAKQDAYTERRAAIHCQLKLIFPLWEAGHYKYKHDEILALFERAQNPNEDGSW